MSDQVISDSISAIAITRSGYLLFTILDSRFTSLLSILFQTKLPSDNGTGGSSRGTTQLNCLRSSLIGNGSCLVFHSLLHNVRITAQTTRPAGAFT